MKVKKFPINGPREAVYGYMGKLGFVMSDWSDKQWKRIDGKTVSIFGAGSMARMSGAEFPLHELEKRLGKGA